MSPTVVVAGGGYAGAAAARALDDVADVVLVEPRERFVHNVAALRALVDPDWTEAVFFPYDRLLDRGRVLRDRVACADGTTVELASGRRLAPDHLVLATGSGYPFPAKVDVDDTADAVAKLHAARASLAQAERAVLLGAGPVGLELAGEIKAAWPEKGVTVIDPADDIVAGDLPDELRAELRRQLGGLGVELVLGTSLRDLPPTEPGEAAPFTVRTRTGRDIDGDIWFRCHGGGPRSGYLAGPLAAARRDSGHIDVTGHLRVAGQDRVFALGDLTALPEAKTAKAAGEHAEVAAATVRALIQGGDAPAAYRPGPPAISLPLGPAGGASYAAGTGVLGPDETARLKGAHLRVETYAALFGPA